MATDYDPTNKTHPILLKDAHLLLTNDYLPLETGYGVLPDGMHHVAANTYMRGCSGKMVDWWFGFIHNTEQYKWWHPRDHLFSDWDGPRNNDSTYIGGTHLVEEYIGKDKQNLAIEFRSPELYFGLNWKEDFAKYGYSTAVCGRGHNWDRETGDRFATTHLIHLIKDEPDGCRMRSRFWLGDFDSHVIDGKDIFGDLSPEDRANLIPPGAAKGLMQHCVEEMAILAAQLPDLYQKYSKDGKASL